MVTPSQPKYLLKFLEKQVEDICFDDTVNCSSSIYSSTG
ncbi:hypothetical protein COO91_01981 [Nostoc flagelliforme CCNUN1]|uniref:Uncharacterized protein n=1 Tax=Nostoc flagelliforme CCNUN1 TaxID=2038116 RepID=A0A2K8SKW2_9NOSO|nr:hypothetical protein COO91_01981 [Nostoc flagelliforme CCNUN1]